MTQHIFGMGKADTPDWKIDGEDVGLLWVEGRLRPGNWLARILWKFLVFTIHITWQENERGRLKKEVVGQFENEGNKDHV